MIIHVLEAEHASHIHDVNDVFHDNDQSYPQMSRTSIQRRLGSIHRVTVNMPDVEEPSAPMQMPDLPAGWDERQVIL